MSRAKGGHDTALLVDAATSARIEHGAVGNRVRVYKRPGRAPKPKLGPKQRGTPGRKPKLGPKQRRAASYRKDRTTAGRPYKVICISIPVDELVVLDAFADRVQMARSDVLRQAAKHFRVQVLGDEA